MKTSTSQTTDAEKYKAVDELLTGEHILVHLKTECDGLLLPDHLRSQNTVTLKLSRYFQRPVKVNKDAINAELLFKGEYFECIIPWSALWGITSIDGEGRVWAEDVPTDLLAEIITPTERKAETAVKSETSEKASKPLPQRAHLKRVK